MGPGSGSASPPLLLGKTVGPDYRLSPDPPGLTHGPPLQLHSQEEAGGFRALSLSPERKHLLSRPSRATEPGDSPSQGPFWCVQALPVLSTCTAPPGDARGE